MLPQQPNTNDRSQEFIRLYRQHDRNLYSYVLSLILDATAADEIVQDTSLRLWEQFDQFDPTKDFGAWSRTVAYYHVLKYRKKLSREHLQFNSELLEMLADRAALRCDELETRQNYLIECLAKLSEFKRQIIQLYYRLGMTAKRVAETLGRDVAGVEKTLLRTRTDLRECIEAAVRREGHP